MPRLWELLGAALPISGAAQINEPLKNLIWGLLQQRSADVRFVLPKQPPAAPAAQTWVPSSCCTYATACTSLAPFHTVRCSWCRSSGAKRKRSEPDSQALEVRPKLFVSCDPRAASRRSVTACCGQR